MLGNLRYQTCPPSETLTYVSGMSAAGTQKLREQFPDVTFTPCENLEDWGHQKRSLGLQAATGDYLGFFNDDDSYTLDYLEQMLGTAARTGADVVYCGWNEQPNCQFHLGSSTAGNFVARTSVAQAAEYRERVYEADGHFIDQLAQKANQVVKVDHVLYFHNQQP